MKSNTRAAKAKSKKIQRKTHIKRREENEVCQIAENGRHWQEPNQDLLLLKQTMLATTLQSRRGEEIFLSYSRGQKIGHTYLPKYFLLSYLYVYSFKHTHTHHSMKFTTETETKPTGESVSRQKPRSFSF